MENEIITNVAEAAEKAVEENLPVVEEVVKKSFTSIQKGLCVAGGFVAGGLTSFAIKHIPGVKEGLEAFDTARKAKKEEKKAAKAAKKQQKAETTEATNPSVEG